MILLKVYNNLPGFSEGGATAGRGQVYPLIGLGIGFEAGLLGLAGAGNLTQQAGLYYGLSLALFAIFLLAIRLVLRPARLAPTASDRAVTGVIVFFAILFRLSLIPVAPSLSTDQFRYTWEGRLVTLGVSPYRYAPDDPALRPYRSEIWPLVQQRETASPYPPLAQVIGAAQYLQFGENLLGPKISAVFFDILNCLALLWLLRLYGLAAPRVILYGWCPLPVLEFGISGHNDAPMLFLLLVSIGLLLRRKPGWSALVLGLAILTKFTALFGLPLFVAGWRLARAGQAGPVDRPGWQWRWLREGRLWLYPGLSVVVVVAGYLPFVVTGQGALGSLFEYTGSWRDNDALVFQLAADTLGLFAAKAGSLVVLAVAGLGLVAHPRLAAELSLPRRLMLLLGIILMVASTVHPWYVTWVVVLLPLVYGQGFRQWDYGWLLFTALVQLPYLTYAGDGSPYRWIKPLEYLPLYLLIAWNGWRGWRNQAALARPDQPAQRNLTNDSIA